MNLFSATEGIILRCFGNSWIGDVARLVERRTGTPLTQLAFPGAARDFLSESTFSADSLNSLTPPPDVQFPALDIL